MIRNDFPRIALALIDAGANLDHVTGGSTPLDLAVKAGAADVVERIREVHCQRMRYRTYNAERQR